MPIDFIKEALLSRKTTGALIPSSNKLAHAIVKKSNIAKAKMVVELGPGTGIITKHIAKDLKRGTDFFAIELNDNLAKSASKKFPDLTIYNGCATEISKFMKIHGASQCDSIISGLPWVSFPEPLQICLLDAINNALDEGGEFITFAYFGLHQLPAGRRIRKLLKERFSRVDRTEIIWKNVPPAFIYHCIK